jgi:hypothetical protein
MKRPAKPSKPLSKSRTGPDPEALAVPGPREDAVSRAIRAAKPATGFPKRATARRATPKQKARPPKRTVKTKRRP